ncbi:Oidioi.mRNA.OKI2018_I69.chr2.g6542.t1.cds [Oikopleura dioica]|uniref:Oidioi.mRNA.OKI2018_I69.chr2.g6542.t1.cds n=1 Tax=Oikopleura dioica TaxID=34765 RepID=A0ABN7T9X9_OIKDI|nr:Oidioi.mRNA.OKI2018_I69.chr2.g6542.t1.cds [Oikopleura dioica]
MKLSLATLSCVAYGVNISNRPSCTKTVEAGDDWDQIKSPNFPGDAGQAECMYIISAPEGRTIELGFSSTFSNCDRQSLHIVDVANENDFKLCESTTEPIVSTGNLVYSLFTSNAETGSFVMDFRLRPAQQNEEESKSISETETTTTETTTTASTMETTTTEEMSTMRANFAFDNPVFDKASMLGGKTDMQNKKMIKYGIIAMGFACGGIVLWLLMRKMMGIQNGGIPEPENKLPEGTIPTHVKAINEYKEKLKSLGRELPSEG